MFFVPFLIRCNDGGREFAERMPATPGIDELAEQAGDYFVPPSEEEYVIWSCCSCKLLSEKNV